MTEIKSKIENFVIIFGDFNIFLPIIDGDRHKLSKDIEDMNNTIELQDSQ